MPYSYLEKTIPNMLLKPAATWPGCVSSLLSIFPSLRFSLNPCQTCVLLCCIATSCYFKWPKFPSSMHLVAVHKLPREQRRGGGNEKEGVAQWLLFLPQIPPFVWPLPSFITQRRAFHIITLFHLSYTYDYISERQWVGQGHSGWVFSKGAQYSGGPRFKSWPLLQADPCQSLPSGYKLPTCCSDDHHQLRL